MTYQSTILIVDDDANARFNLESLLLREGHALVFAQDGPEALERAAALDPDLILLDVMMPGMDGFAVCQQLRATPKLNQIPVLMITALDDRESRLRGIEVGADDFIAKPFDRVELRARVRTILQLNRYRRLLQERERFEWVVQHADDGFLLLDSNDRICYANPQARSYLNLPPPEADEAPASPLSEAPFLDLVKRQYQLHPDSAWNVWDDADMTQTSYLVRPETADHSAFWLQVNVLAIGDVEATRLVRLRDVTAAIVTRNNTWSFHALVNHKLRTPLGILTGFINMLNNSPTMFGPDEMREAIQMMESSARALRADILDIFEYMNAVNLDEIAPRPCGIDEIPKIATEIKLALGINNLEIVNETPAGHARDILAIPHHALKVILWELLENAQKFHPQHTPNVTLILIPAGTEGIRLRLSDDGVTLAPNQLARIWSPYYQSEKYFTGQVPGMGLGLAVVAALVWSVGGKCRAYNRDPEPGLVIELFLPWHLRATTRLLPSNPKQVE